MCKASLFSHLRLLEDARLVSILALNVAGGTSRKKEKFTCLLCLSTHPSKDEVIFFTNDGMFYITFTTKCYKYTWMHNLRSVFSWTSALANGQTKHFSFSAVFVPSFLSSIHVPARWQLLQAYFTSPSWWQADFYTDWLSTPVFHDWVNSSVGFAPVTWLGLFLQQNVAHTVACISGEANLQKC